LRVRSVAVALLCAGLALPAHASPAAVPTPFIVGNWYGEEQPHDPNVFWLAHFWPDGRFKALFRTCHGKTTEDEDDSGSWTLRDGVLEVTSVLVNGHAIHQPERYRTISFDGRKHVYRHERTGFVFSAVRVDSDFQLASCNLSS
jgi:hypothetical protein